MAFEIKMSYDYKKCPDQQIDCLEETYVQITLSFKIKNFNLLEMYFSE